MAVWRKRYMYQPQGFEDISAPNLVFKLLKVIYRFKQVPRAWFHKLSASLLTLGFYNSKANTSMFVQLYGAQVTILLVHVDDIILTGNDTTYLIELTLLLNSCFILKDLRDLSYFLGIQIVRDANTLHLN